MKNHYISQFIIKRFSNAINVFDLQSQRINESKRPDKTFYKNDIYTEELERLMSFNIESRVANLLDKKILNCDEIRLTRADLLLLKTYMLLCSVRTLSEEHFARLLKGFKGNADKYIIFEPTIAPLCNDLKSTSELKVTDHELYLRALEVFATSKEIVDIAKNPLATREMLVWAMPFMDSYIAFWDTTGTDEFILTDCGMCSEYEGFHQLTGGLDISKVSYLLHQIKDGKVEYVHCLACCCAMYENYNFFNLSKNRTLVMINPFFRLYDNMQVLMDDKTIYLEKPDIWPAVIQNKELFGVPDNVYKYGRTFHSDEDLFIYTPNKLTREETIYINSLILRQTNTILGFNDAKNIIDSIYYYLYLETNYKSVTRLDITIEEIANNLMNAFEASPYRKLAEYCEIKGGINKMEFIFLFEKLTQNILKDFRENPYICEYCLDRPMDTINCDHLNFLGEGPRKLEFFKKHLENIEKERAKNENNQ